MHVAHSMVCFKSFFGVPCSLHGTLQVSDSSLRGLVAYLLKYTML